jgi:TonB family protein
VAARRTNASSRRRALAALGVALAFHLLALPALVRELARADARKPKAMEVSLFTRSDARPPSPARPDAARDRTRVPTPAREKTAAASKASVPAAAKPDAPKELEKIPDGQVVAVPPHGDRPPEHARYLAENDSRVEHETVARDRAPDWRNVMDRATSPHAGEAKEEPGAAAAVGLEGAGARAAGQQGAEAGQGDEWVLELPDVRKRQRLALRVDPEFGGGADALQGREASDELRGNSDRFRILRPADKDGDDGRAPGAASLGRVQLFPGLAVQAPVAGAPAADHLPDVEEGDATYLNAAEWKHAGFLNRVKRDVYPHWRVGEALRDRDPTGLVYGWKDRYTLVSVTLAPDGEVRDVFVAAPSGVEFLDRAAVQAFRSAAKFPNPPRALQDSTGEIHFAFGFAVEFSGAPAVRVYGPAYAPGTDGTLR